MFPQHYDALPASVIIGLYEQAYNHYLGQVAFAENLRDRRFVFHDDKKTKAAYNYEMAIIRIEDIRQKNIIEEQSRRRPGERSQQKIREINTSARKAGVRAKFNKEQIVKTADKSIAKALKKYPKDLANATREPRKMLGMWERYAQVRPQPVSLPPKSY